MGAFHFYKTEMLSFIILGFMRTKVLTTNLFIAVIKKVRRASCPMPYALCPMPYALCPMPHSTSYESLKGYNCFYARANEF